MAYNLISKCKLSEDYSLNGVKPLHTLAKLQIYPRIRWTSYTIFNFLENDCIEHVWTLNDKNIICQTHHLLLKNKRPTWCHLLFYFTSYVLNMFRTLIYPSSGACDYSVELPHWSCCSWFDACWRFGVVGLEWYPCCRLKHTDTTPTQPHRISNTHRTKNKTTNVVIQQKSRKLLMMDILMSETLST